MFILTVFCKEHQSSEQKLKTIKNHANPARNGFGAYFLTLSVALGRARRTYVDLLTRRACDACTGLLCHLQSQKVQCADFNFVVSAILDNVRACGVSR